MGDSRACESECAVPIRTPSHSIVSVLGQPEIPAFVASVFPLSGLREMREMRDASEKKKKQKINKWKKWRGASAFRRNWPRRDNAERRLTAPLRSIRLSWKYSFIIGNERERERERVRGGEEAAQPPSKPPYFQIIRDRHGCAKTLEWHLEPLCKSLSPRRRSAPLIRRGFYCTLVGRRARARAIASIASNACYDVASVQRCIFTHPGKWWSGSEKRFDWPGGGRRRGRR